MATARDVLEAVYLRRAEDGIPSNDTEIKRSLSFLSQAYRHLLRDGKYWFLIKSQSFDAVNGQTEYDLPDDFNHDIGLRYRNLKVFKESLRTITNTYYPTDLTFFERFYYIKGDKLITRPAPSSDETNAYTLTYYYLPTFNFTSLDDEIVLPDEYIDALISFVFARQAQMDGEKGDAQDGFLEFNEIMRQLNIDNVNRMIALSDKNGITEYNYY